MEGGRIACFSDIVSARGLGFDDLDYINKRCQWRGKMPVQDMHYVGYVGFQQP